MLVIASATLCHANLQLLGAQHFQRLSVAGCEHLLADTEKPSRKR